MAIGRTNEYASKREKDDNTEGMKEGKKGVRDEDRQELRMC
jgi:hypothetical protein